MAKRQFQFGLRALLAATGIIALLIWAAEPKILLPWLMTRPREWQIEWNYRRKGGAEVERLKKIQASLPAPDPDIARKINDLEWELFFEPKPESQGGDLDR